MPITMEIIFKAADELNAEGKNPTLAALRERIGGGSFTTISEAMKVWRKRKPATQPTVAREPMPTAIAERLAGAGEELWAKAIELADFRFSDERNAFCRTRTDLEEENSEATDLADKLTADLCAAKEVIADLESKLADMSCKYNDLQATFSGTAENLSVTMARLEETATRADNLNRELSRINRQNKDLLKKLPGTTSGERRKAGYGRQR